MSQQQVFSDRYEMVQHIARGGMAQVYLARDLLLDRPVALKVLFPELSIDRSFVERFRREAKAAANLSHPNIVSIYDWGQGEHTYFIVMEYVDGPTLSSLLRQGPLDATRAASIGASVAAALAFAHQRGVIHRDVKPGNVLMDERGQVKVADFGIARAIGSSEDLTQTGSVMGTATYFSPEQAQGFPVDARSDVYSLGVVLYEMVAGKAPFTGDSPVSIAYKHVTEAVTPPSQINREIPSNFEAIVMKALAKDPADRYQSADDLHADLVRFGNGQPVSAAAAATMMLGAVAGGSRLGGEPTMVQARSAGTTVLPVTETRGIGAPPPNDGSRGWVYALIGLLLLLLLVGGYFLGRHEGWFGSSVKNLTIPPNLVNQPAPAAQTELQQKGFTNVTTHPLASSTIVSGNVVSSTPGPGATVKSNAAVVLNVSSGPTQVTVPTVAGQTQALATQALRKAGFVVNPTSQSSSSVPQGTVIGTSPTGGQPAAQGSAVTMIVSSGKQLVKIPPLVGEDPATAGQQLGALQLVVTPMDEASPTLPAGQVTRTDPAAGTPVPVGSTVIVYVSTGPPQVQVPDLSNQTRSQADQALKAVGLKGAFTTVPVSDRSQAGIVQSQSPSAPTSVPQGSTVDVAIGTYQPPTTTTSTIPGPLSGGGGSSG